MPPLHKQDPGTIRVAFGIDHWIPPLLVGAAPNKASPQAWLEIGFPFARFEQDR
jgi:hypothetical protein